LWKSPENYGNFFLLLRGHPAVAKETIVLGFVVNFVRNAFCWSTIFHARFEYTSSLLLRVAHPFFVEFSISLIVHDLPCGQSDSIYTHVTSYVNSSYAVVEIFGKSNITTLGVNVYGRYT